VGKTTKIYSTPGDREPQTKKAENGQLFINPWGGGKTETGENKKKEPNGAADWGYIY